MADMHLKASLLVEEIKNMLNNLGRLGYHAKTDNRNGIVFLIGGDEPVFSITADGSPEQINGPDRGAWGVIAE